MTKKQKQARLQELLICLDFSAVQIKKEEAEGNTAEAAMIRNRMESIKKEIAEVS